MPEHNRQFAISEVVSQLLALGIEQGDVLLVHTSFRAVRPIEHGPIGLIEALSDCIGPEGTLVMPSWTGNDDAPFDPATTPSSPDLGAVAGLFWQQTSVARSRHPFAFAARGPEAQAIVSDPMTLPPHQHASPVGRVLDCDGRILLLGVEHDANTSIHMCELMANVPYRRRKHITAGSGGNVARIEYAENDHCCQRFREVDAWLDKDGLQSQGPVGNAMAKLVTSRALVETVTRTLKHDRFAFLHPRGTDCHECTDAWRSLQKP